MPDLKLEQVKVRQIVDQFSRGELSVPEFQRDYVWPPTKAAKLLDSLYKKYPISCLLAWESTRKVEHKDNRHRSAPLRWIIDGQQRVRTLQKVRDGDLEIIFHVDKCEFARASATSKYDTAWIRVADIWQDDSYREIRGGLSIVREQHLDDVRRILDYEIPLVTMIGHEFDAAVDSFDRINTLGVKLKRADIESAKIAEKHATFIRNEFTPFLKELQEQRRFQRLSSTHLFRACGFLAHPDARKRTLLHELDTNEVREAWKKTKRATLSALKILQNELGIYDMSLLWSGSLLVPVICLCDKPVTERNDKEIAGWIALAALHHRYSQGSDSAVDQDLRACRAADPISALLANIRGKRVGLMSGDWSFQGTIADRSSLFAAYVACRHLNAMDLITGGKVGSNVDRHHIFPRALFKDKQVADEIANIAFITGDANKSIKDAHPSMYLSKISPEVLQSQAIPTDRTLWDIDQATAFWQKRRTLLSDAFNNYIRSVLPTRKQL